jgi:hypothetical protein
LTDDIEDIDPSKILYSTPTIPEVLPPMVAISDTDESDVFTIHEDDWSQIEFLHPQQLGEVQELMAEYERFERESRRPGGWKNVFVRGFDHVPLFSAAHPKEVLLALLGASEGNRPIVHSFDVVHGLVENGFSITLGTDVALYGYALGTDMKALGASPGENPDHQSLVDSFGQLNKEFGLVLADWRSQFILVGIQDSGEVDVWQPH